MHTPSPPGSRPVPLYPAVPLYGGGASLRPKCRGAWIHTMNHVYAEAHGAGLFMDIFQPASPNGLAIIDVVSTAWHSGRAQIYEHVGLGVYDALCDAGFTVFALCPGSATQYSALQMAHHVRAGIRYLKVNHDRWSIAPDRLGLLGASAGGHLAALAALQPESAHDATRNPFLKFNTCVAAVCLFFAPTDLLDFAGSPFVSDEIAGRQIPRLLIDEDLPTPDAAAVTEGLAAISPARLAITAPPPFLVFHGDEDPLVPLEQSEKLVDALRKAGGQAELRVKKGGAHPWPTVAHEVRAAADWFLGLLAP
ncbi:MAG: prolyl oligopeptidase family serine peptidase [Candidatus Hydrogenedentes bacterium]|nr:prolyl oligopeptidase family serine peptidase [Candidatus Hydrogenedentota bacterium]